MIAERIRETMKTLKDGVKGLGKHTINFLGNLVREDYEGVGQLSPNAQRILDLAKKTVTNMEMGDTQREAEQRLVERDMERANIYTAELTGYTYKKGRKQTTRADRDDRG